MILGRGCPNVIGAICGAAVLGISFGLTTLPDIEIAVLVCSVVSAVETPRMVSSYTELRSALNACVASNRRAARGIFMYGSGRCYAAARKSGMTGYVRRFNILPAHGILIAPLQYGAMFISAAHTKGYIRYLIGAPEEKMPRRWL